MKRENKIKSTVNDLDTALIKFLANIPKQEIPNLGTP